MIPLKTLALFGCVGGVSPAAEAPPTAKAPQAEATPDTPEAMSALERAPDYDARRRDVASQRGGRVDRVALGGA
jgi:hypothetical protein